MTGSSNGFANLQINNSEMMLLQASHSRFAIVRSGPGSSGTHPGQNLGIAVSEGGRSAYAHNFSAN